MDDIHFWSNLSALAALAGVVGYALLAGADFATLAAEISDDPTAQTNRGELGWFAASKMDPAFSKAACKYFRSASATSFSKSTP